MKERNTQTIENEKLFNAIEREDLNAAKEVLSNGADVNHKPIILYSVYQLILDALPIILEFYINKHIYLSYNFKVKK